MYLLDLYETDNAFSDIKAGYRKLFGMVTPTVNLRAFKLLGYEFKPALIAYQEKFDLQRRLDLDYTFDENLDKASTPSQAQREGVFKTHQKRPINVEVFVSPDGRYGLIVHLGAEDVTKIRFAANHRKDLETLINFKFSQFPVEGGTEVRQAAYIKLTNQATIVKKGFKQGTIVAAPKDQNLQGQIWKINKFEDDGTLKVFRVKPPAISYRTSPAKVDTLPEYIKKVLGVESADKAGIAQRYAGIMGSDTSVQGRMAGFLTPLNPDQKRTLRAVLQTMYPMHMAYFDKTTKPVQEAQLTGSSPDDNADSYLRAYLSDVGHKHLKTIPDKATILDTLKTRRKTIDTLPDISHKPTAEERWDYALVCLRRLYPMHYPWFRAQLGLPVLGSSES